MIGRARAALGLFLTALVLPGAAGCISSSSRSAPPGAGETEEDPARDRRPPKIEVRTESPPVDPQAPADRILFPSDRRPEPRFLEKADGRLTKFYPTKPKKAEKLARLLTAHLRLPADQVTFQADFERANFPPPPKEKPIDHYDLVIVTGTKEEIQHVDRFIEMVEARMPVIEIEAKIVEITNDSDFQLGVQAFFREADSIRADGTPVADPEVFFRGLTSRFDSDEFISAGTARTDFSGAILDFRAIHDEFLVDILIQALQKESHAEILSAPKVAVLNGYSAEIVTGTEVPVQSAQLVGSQVFLNVTFVQTGITLSVTPYVINKDTVQLVVAPEVSAVTGFTQAVQGGFSNPIISTRNARTVVNIRNGATYVIGGLISSVEIEDERKTPLLGDIPLLKYLFRSSRTRKVYTQLVFFITPRIIASGSTPPPTIGGDEGPR